MRGAVSRSSLLHPPRGEEIGGHHGHSRHNNAGGEAVGIFGQRQDERFQRDVLQHVPAGYNLARWLLGNDHDAEDAIQEASIRAFRAFKNHRGGDAKAWYLAIVRNSCMNLLRSRNKVEVVDEDVVASSRVEAPGPAELVERAYDAERLRGAIESLPPTWREMIILREFEQLSYREIAEIATVPIGTVMSRLSRARERLHELLCEEQFA